jgi:hypothetical protein
MATMDRPTTDRPTAAPAASNCADPTATVAAAFAPGAHVWAWVALAWRPAVVVYAAPGAATVTYTLIGPGGTGAETLPWGFLQERQEWVGAVDGWAAA